MKENRLTPGSNMMWNMKFILPEHNEAMQAQQEKAKRRVKPEMDEQELELVFAEIGRSYNERESLTVEIFEPIQNRLLEGIVEKMDAYQKRIFIDGEWVKVQDIIGVK